MMSEERVVRIPFIPFVILLVPTRRDVVAIEEYRLVNCSYFWFASATRGTRKSILPLLFKMLERPASSPTSVFPVAVAEMISWFFLSRRPASIESAWTGISSSICFRRSFLSSSWSERSFTFILVSTLRAAMVSNLVSPESSFPGLSIANTLSRFFVFSSIWIRRSWPRVPSLIAFASLTSSFFAQSSHTDSLWNRIGLFVVNFPASRQRRHVAVYP